MSFPRLLEAALAGAMRQEPPPGLDADSLLSAESRMLRSASFEGMRRLAGRQLERVENGQSVEPAGRELLAEVPAAAAARLGEILEARPGLLREWLRLAAASKLRVPPIELPDLLDYAATDTDAELRELIMDVGGERMLWLAGLNPDWQFAAYADPEQQLAHASREERSGALRRIRRHDPVRGRQLLQDLWLSERGDARAKLLESLSVGLSAADEPFAAQAITDARKEVRETALRLIRRIPNSAFGRRWAERARQVFTLPQGAGLVIHQPTQLDGDWLADGLDARAPKGVGETAWLLQQILALTPPSIWPLAALSAIDHTDWPRALLAGLATAAEAYADGEWCVALLLLWATTSERRALLPLSPKALFAALDPTRAEAVLQRIAQHDPALVDHLVDARTLEYRAAMVRELGQN